MRVFFLRGVYFSIGGVFFLRGVYFSIGGCLFSEVSIFQ